MEFVLFIWGTGAVWCWTKADKYVVVAHNIFMANCESQQLDWTGAKEGIEGSLKKSDCFHEPTRSGVCWQSNFLAVVALDSSIRRQSYVHNNRIPRCGFSWSPY